MALDPQVKYLQMMKEIKPSLRWKENENAKTDTA